MKKIFKEKIFTERKERKREREKEREKEKGIERKKLIKIKSTKKIVIKFFRSV